MDLLFSGTILETSLFSWVSWTWTEPSHEVARRYSGLQPGSLKKRREEIPSFGGQISSKSPSLSSGETMVENKILLKRCMANMPAILNCKPHFGAAL